jgi:hypothetical protein
MLSNATCGFDLGLIDNSINNSSDDQAILTREEQSLFSKSGSFCAH